MGFFDAVRNVFQGKESPDHPQDTKKALAAAWGLEDFEESRDRSTEPRHSDPKEYDRKQWRRKVQRILGELPGSQGDWPDCIADARALDFESAWIYQVLREEFMLLVRRMVADRQVTESEHRKIDLARDLMGIPDADAEAMLRQVVREAENFFGDAVKGA